MSDSAVPAILTRAGNAVGEYWKEIFLVVGFLGGLISMINLLFGVRLVPVGHALINIFSDNVFISALLVSVLATQVMLYQRVEWLVKQTEKENQRRMEDVEGEDELETDGGSELPPRDSEGKFTSKDSGGSNLLLLVLAAVAGYLLGNQSGAIEPFAAALLAVAIVAFLQYSDT